MMVMHIVDNFRVMTGARKLERATGIEPVSEAWDLHAAVGPDDSNPTDLFGRVAASLAGSGPDSGGTGSRGGTGGGAVAAK